MRLRALISPRPRAASAATRPPVSGVSGDSGASDESATSGDVIGSGLAGARTRGPLRGSPLFRRTLLFMVLTFGAMAMASSLLSAAFLHDRLSREYESKAMALAGGLADSDLEALLDRDAAVVQSKIDQYLEIEGVAYVSVVDGDGETVAHTFTPVEPPALTDLARRLRRESPVGAEPALTRLTFADGAYLNASFPVLAGYGGWVHVGMDLGRINAFVRDAILTHHGATFAIFLLSVTIAFFFVRSVTTPLARLAAQARRFAAHDFSERLDVRGANEVSQLAAAMQSMGDDLAALIDELESRVAQSTRELHETTVYLRAILDNMAHGLVVSGEDGTIAQLNPAMLRMLGKSEEDVQGRSVREVFGEEFERVLRGRGGMRRAPEVEILGAEGELIPVELTISVLQVEGRRSVITMVRDIVERRKAESAMQRAQELLEDQVRERTQALKRMNSQLQIEAHERTVVGEALRRAENKYRAIFENAVEGIFQSTPEGRYISVNPALARIYGYATPEELMTAIRSIDAQLYLDPKRRKDFKELMAKHGEVVNFESEVRRKDGSIIWISENARAIYGADGDILYYEGSTEDITLRRAAESQLRRQAFHDPLTGLPNRLLFLDHLNMALERSKRRSGYLFAVLYMDLDRFKIINDSLGHDIGDELLVSISRIVLDCVRSMDTVARFGGDEFAILLEDIDSPREGVKIARRILEDIGQPLTLSGHEVFTTGSIGIVLVTEGYERPESILRDADTAMYRAKEQGKARFKVFNQRMHEEAMRILELETDLRRAAEQQELYLVYQPIVDVEAGHIAGFEALMRWRHPRHGFISPTEFIPLAEDTGLIFELGRQSLIAACREATRWRDIALSTGAPAPHVSVNISGKQFMQPQLANEVEQILLEADLSPQLLTLEITENVLMDHVDVAGAMIGRLRKLGVSISMDDFGTGYSSLSYLRKFPIDTLKIDRAFIASASQEQESEAIIRTVIALGRSLGMEVVAEGVEDVQQLTLLRERGCSLIQGYLLARPLDAEDAAALFATGVRIPSA